MSKNWYRIDIIEGDKSRGIVGTSEFEPAQLIKQLNAGTFLMLTDVSYRDNQNRIVPISTWDPRLGSIVYINSKNVSTIIPFAGDPRNGGPPAQ